MTNEGQKSHITGSLEIHIPGICFVGMGSLVGPEVRAGNGCVIGTSVQIVGLVTLGANVEIGDDSVLRGPLTIGADCRIGRKARIGFPEEIGGKGATAIGRGCEIGRKVMVPNGTTIGDDVFIKAHTVLIGDVPDHALVGGHLSTLLDYLCPCGGSLEYYSNDEWACRICGERIPQAELDYSKLGRILLPKGEVGSRLVRPSMYASWLGLEEF